MQHGAQTVVIEEMCPSCGDVDVRAIEPGFFVLELERGDEVRSAWADEVEFSCRGCGIVWR